MLKKLLLLASLVIAGFSTSAFADCGGTKQQQIDCEIALTVSNPPVAGKNLLVGDSYVKLWESAATGLAPAALTRVGVSGMQAADLYTYRQGLMLVHNPKRVILSIGQNDIHNGASAATTVSRIQDIVTKIKEHNATTEVIILSIPPSPIRSCQHASPDPDCETNSYPDEFNEMPVQEAANASLITYAANTVGVKYVDVNDVLFDSYPTLDLAYYSSDELHLKVNGVAYGLWEGIVSPYVNASVIPEPVVRNIEVEWCDLLGTIAYELGFCYPEITANNATNVTHNSAQVIVDTDRTNKGVIYAYPTTSCSTAPSVATMLAAQQQTVTGANNTFTITGLTPSTTGYCVWAMQEWDRRYSSIVKTASTFNTGSGPAAPEPDDPAQGSTAPVYYISYSAGNDSNNGTSVSTPWKNLSKATALSGTTSAKVYLLSGDDWPNQSADLDWSGTASDWAFFGCYKVVSGAGKICAADDPDPTVSGPITDTCHTNKNCPYGTSTGGVAVWDDGQITIDADYFKMQDVTIRNTIASGLQVVGAGYSSPGSTKYVTAKRVNTYRTGARGYIILNGVQKFVARDGSIDMTGQCKAQAKSGGLATAPQCQSTSNLITGSMPIVASPNCDCLVENMTVTRSTGEPMNAYSRSSHVVFRGNRTCNAVSVNYTDQSSHVVYESNMGCGTVGNMGYPTSSNFGGGWEVNIEDSCQTVGNCSSSFNVAKYLNRNNITWNSGGYSAGMQPFAVSQGRTIEAKFINNLSLKVTTNDIQVRRGPANIINFEAKANIFGSKAPGTSPCSLVGTHPGFGYNIWGGPMPVTGCRSGTDKYVPPTFAVNHTDTYLGTINYTNLDDIQPEDFTPTTTSPQYRAGDPSLATRDYVDIAGFSYALTQMTYPFTPDPVTWGKMRAYDFFGNLAHPTHPDAGPIQYVAP